MGATTSVGACAAAGLAARFYESPLVGGRPGGLPALVNTANRASWPDRYMSPYRGDRCKATTSSLPLPGPLLEPDGCPVS